MALGEPTYATSAMAKPYRHALTGDTAIDKPAHYNQSGIECIDAIIAAGCGADFCRGNVIKYLWRADYKGRKLEDFKKALWYLKKLIEIEEGKG